MVTSNKILGTNYKRKKNFLNSFNYLEPLSIPINESAKKYFAYVPVLKTLATMFDDQSLKNHFNCPSRNDQEKFLQDFFDGTVYKNNKLFQENPTALKVIFISRFF